MLRNLAASVLLVLAPHAQAQDVGPVGNGWRVGRDAAGCIVVKKAGAEAMMLYAEDLFDLKARFEGPRIARQSGRGRSVIVTLSGPKGRHYWPAEGELYDGGLNVTYPVPGPSAYDPGFVVNFAEDHTITVAIDSVVVFSQPLAGSGRAVDALFKCVDSLSG